VEVWKEGNGDIRGTVTVKRLVAEVWVQFATPDGPKDEARIDLRAARNPQQLVLRFNAVKLPRAPTKTEIALVFEVDSGKPAPEAREIFRPDPVEEHGTYEHRIEVALVRPAELFLDRTIIFLCENRPQHLIPIRNLGGAELRLTGIELPAGLELVDADGKALGPREALANAIVQANGRFDLYVRAMEGATVADGARITITTDDPQQRGEVLAVNEPRAATVAASLPAYDLGFDFGTSKVAVAAVDASGQLHDLFNEPSLVLLRERGGGGVEWFFCSEAEREYPAPRTGRRELIEELKLKLADQQVQALGRGRPTEELLSRLLRYVTNRVVGRLEDREEGDWHSWCLTVPVWDLSATSSEAPHYTQQVRITERAAKGVGAAEEIVILPEPLAAAIGIVTDLQRERDLGLQAGDLVCVYDSGAGTLDITVVEIKGPQEMVVRAYLGEFKDGQGNDLAVAGKHFDRRLADHLVLTGRLGRYRHQDGRDRVYPAGAQPSEGDVEYDQLVRDMRIVKERLCSPRPGLAYGDRANYRQEYPGEGETDESSLAKLGVKLALSTIDEALAPPIGESMDLVNRMAQEQGLPLTRLKWVFLVGGSSLLPCMWDRAREHWGQQRVILPRDAEEAVLAVARGAAKRRQIRLGHAAARKLRAVHRQSGREWALWSEDALWPATQHARLRPARGAAGVWELQVEHGPAWRRLATFSVPRVEGDNATAHLLVQASADGELNVTVEFLGGPAGWHRALDEGMRLYV